MTPKRFFVALLQLQAFVASAMYRPAEWDHHDGIIMAWPSIENDAYADKGGSRDLAAATRDISAIAEAVAEFEEVTLLVTPDRLKEAKKRFKHDPDDIIVQPVHDFPKLDLWMRDMAPTFVFDGCHLSGVDYNFNGWGNKYPVAASESLASQVCDNMDRPRISTWLVTEGGSLEVDGDGTLLITESSIINENRNPGKTREQIEDELRRTLGVSNIIWLPGVKGGDVTDGHVDGLARFVAPGKVVISKPNTLDNTQFSAVFKEAYSILSNATDAHGQRIEVIEMVEADLYSLGLDKGTLKDIESEEEDYPSLSYVNWLLVNGGVIFPQFGDKKADAAALKIIRDLYQDRRVMTVRLDQLPFLGGGIHCSTQEVPAA
ncbi:agmatine deiminase [Penicillium antarcticum]|uniref:agmatine deiminase n=1 Tax=Penicillium antarcticum TaxID=416450 RepID=UPI00239F9E21|nr:agmatine deiminase [Penicillium antarcticum]KAJ5294885.1 agmatine deiminase [Penicillium antarcticum]